MIKYEMILRGFRRIFCDCSQCGEVFRLSDTDIISDERDARDWLSEIDSKIENLEINIEKAEEQHDAKAAKIVARERKLVERKTSRQVCRLVPNFAKMRLNMRDVKTIGHPVKFVSFDGRDVGAVKKIRFLDFEPSNRANEALLKSLERTLRIGNIEWKTIRVLDDGNLECQ
jgi:predicted Holliday junction resolvase-like endonuclease